MTDYVNPSTRIGGVKQIVVAEPPPTNQVDDAPFDDEQYVRVNGEWVPYTAPPIIPDTLDPKPPTGLSGSGAMAGDGTSVTYSLEWTAPTQNTDNSPLTDFAYYVLRWRYAGLTGWSTFTTNDTEYLLPNLLPATNIEWEVLARDTSGNDSTWASNTVTGVTDTTGPIMPSAPGLGSRLGSVVITWDGFLIGATAPPADFSYLEVYTSSAGGGPWTAIGRLSGTGAVVVAGVEVGVERFFSFIAYDTSGNASPRSAATSIVVQGVTGPDIEANAITANMIQTGILDAAVTITGYLLAGNPTGSRVVIDGEGIRQYDSAGNLLTNIPTDPDLPATFEGAVIADSITIKDYMSLQGLANKIARGAVLTLEYGTSSPSQGPSVALGYETYDPNRWSYLYVPVGSHCNIDGSPDLMAASTFYADGVVYGPSNRYYDFPNYTDSTGYPASQYGNIGMSTAIYTTAERLVMSSYRCLSNGAVKTRSLDTFDLMTMNSSGTAAPTVKAHITHPDAADGYTYNYLGRAFSPIGSSTLRATFASLSHRNGQPISLRLYACTDAAITQSGSTLVVSAPFTANEGPIGVTYGSSAKMLFPGADQNIWLVHGSVNTYAYSTAGARLPDFDFPTPPGQSRMNAWGDLATNGFIGFRAMAWSGNTDITKLTNNHWVGATSPKWWISTTNYDANITGGTHESEQGPRAPLTMKKRAGVLVTVPSYPVRPSPTTTDDPLSAKVYLGRGASDPTRPYMEYVGQTDDPNRSLFIGDFTFPAGLAAVPPPNTSNFPASAPAKLQSSSLGADGLPRVLIDGSGFMHGESLDISGAGASALTGKAFEQLYYSIRSQSMLIGGGLISCSATYEVKWSSRFMVISAGKSSDTALNGYFQLDLPSVGATITGYGGATNKTVTANGIPLNAWDALWYELPYGGTQTSVPGNFKVTSYTSNFVVPNNWVLICIRNGDGTNRVEFTTGDKLLAGQDNQLYLSSASAMTAATGWTIATQSCARVGRVVQYYFIATRTGATIASNANGDIGNTSVATIDVDWRPVQPINLSGSIANGALWGGYINAAGTLTLSSLQANVSLANNAQISGSGTGLLA